MTEVVLSSITSLQDYLSKTYKLVLSSEQIQDVELLLQKDKPTLRQLLYRFEDQTMKRKLPPQRGKSAFVDGIAEAAKKCKSKGSSRAEDAQTESYDQSDASFEAFIAQYETPVTSQVDKLSGSTSSGGTDKISPVSTQPTSEGSQDSGLVWFDAAAEECDLERQVLYKQLSYGVKYMLALLMKSGHLSDAVFASPDGLKELSNLSTRQAMAKWLHSPNADLRSTASSFVSAAFLEACDDLDREEGLLEKGSKYLHIKQDGWCGGKVSFAGKITINQQGSIHTRLRPFSVKTSCRFTRRFGSSRFIRLDVPRVYETEEQRKEVIDYLRKPFHILDHRFTLLCIKEKESKEKGTAGWTAIFVELGPDIPSVWHFFDWHGPWRDNAEGRLQKYMQRLFLGLSTSAPGPFIPTNCVRPMDDIISETGEVMTDGAAPISRGAMIKIALALGLTTIPTAVQGRYDGAKGMWYLDTKSSPDEVWIGVRPSQTKLLRSATTDTAHQVFDVVRVAKVTTPSSISLQILFILAHNGVSHHTLVKMQREQLQEIIDNLFGQEESTKDGLELAKTLDEAAHVYFTRAKRAATYLAGAKGWTSRAADDQEAASTEEETEDGETDDMSTEYQPVAERAYDMLLHGFEVDKSATLLELLVRSAKNLLDRAVKEFRTRIVRSAEVYVIPDPTGLLKEGEVQLRFGPNAPIDPDTMMRTANLSGEVLVTRHPCLTPMDIQKVQAAIHPELADYTDVIIFSTKGKRSLASLLSGGDYDGDTIRVFWEPDLVEGFRNASIEQCQPSISIADAFLEDTETVKCLLEANDVSQCERLDDMIISSLRSNGSKGQYGMWQKVAAYTKGCDSQEAIDLAFKFNNSMDGIKTGLAIRDEILKKDRRRYNLTLPRWANKTESDLILLPRNLPPDAKRDRHLGHCIIDVLYDEGHKAAGKLKGELESRQQAQWYKRDADIAHRWEEALRKNTISPLQADVMIEHCRTVLGLHQEARIHHAVKKDEKKTGSVSPSKIRSATRSPVKSGSPIRSGSPLNLLRFTQIPLLYRGWVHDRVKAFEMAGLELPEDENVGLSDLLDESQMRRLEDLLASCLYIQAAKSKHTEKIAFEIAGQELLNLKSVEKKRRLEQEVSSRHCQPIVSLPRSTAHALRLGKVLM